MEKRSNAPKKPSRTSGKAKTSRRKPTAKAVKAAGRVPAFSDEDHIDGCDCVFPDSEATPDAELPPAKGGVGNAPRRRRAAG